MGRGYSYKCEKCHHEYMVFPGKGMTYPEFYQKKLDEIEQGVYGKDWQEIYKATTYPSIDASRVIYVCSSCNNWDEGFDLTLYAPDDPEYISEKRYGEKTVKEWGYVPYTTADDLKNNYHIVKRYYHKCKTCGQRMHKATEDELQNLSCPKCGAPNRSDSPLFWD